MCTVIGAFISRGGSDRRLERKRNRLRARLKHTCPHVEVDYHDGELMIDSLCFSVAGNRWWRCILCGSWFPEEHVRKMLDRWSTRNSEEDGRGATESLRKAESLRRELDELGYDGGR